MNPQATLAASEFWSESLADELLRFLTCKLKCPDLAAEYTHDTYLNLHQVMEKNQPENVRAMAFRIAINLVIDHQRKKKVRNRRDVEGESETAVESSASQAYQPEQIIIGQERYKRLQSALMELPADCRTAFIMHGLEGQTYSEIAVRIGVSKSKVNQLLAQAMRHCAAKLAENY